MRKIYRSDNNINYWEKRWEAAGVDEDQFTDMNIYPIKYAELVMDKSHNILEAGVGSGRLFFHYKNKGKHIRGMDFSQNAIKNIRQKDPSADVICASITDLPYTDNEFDTVLAFGLYHNLENIDDIHKAFEETARVLKKGGKLVFSVRLDSLENNIIEYITRKKNKGLPLNQFHKAQFSIEDIEQILGRSNFKINEYFYVRNVSFLFKFDLFRAGEMKSGNFKESLARSEGFKLNKVGKQLDDFLHNRFPNQFSNLVVAIAEKL